MKHKHNEEEVIGFISDGNGEIINRSILRWDTWNLQKKIRLHNYSLRVKGSVSIPTNYHIIPGGESAGVEETKKL